MTRREAENMTTVGFVGSGAIGTTIARLAVGAGHQVVLSNSRGPETLADGRGTGAAGVRGD
jgi:predicted dinucleotide-binding enzyme